MLTGTLCDGGVLDPMFEALNDSATGGRQIIVRSPSGGRTTVEVARRILENLPPRFALAGFSLGGIVALEMAAQAPGRLAGLALIDSTARPVAPSAHDGRRAEAIAGSGDLETHVRETLWPLYVASGARGNVVLRERIVDMAMRVGSAALIEQTEIALSRVDSRPRLPDLSMPALVLAGVEDVLCTAEMQQEIADGLPNHELQFVTQAGHFALLEQPQVVAQHVAAWLARADQLR